MRVRVYFNLHQKLFSVMYRGRVIGHSEGLELKNCKFIVSEAGRQRVIREQKKNVHAFIEGDVECKNRETSLENFEPVTYNPYRSSFFYNKQTNAPVKQAAQAVLQVVNGVGKVLVK